MKRWPLVLLAVAVLVALANAPPVVAQSQVISAMNNVAVTTLEMQGVIGADGEPLWATSVQVKSFTQPAVATWTAALDPATLNGRENRPTLTGRVALAPTLPAHPFYNAMVSAEVAGLRS